jgi:hypothetical protein
MHGTTGSSRSIRQPYTGPARCTGVAGGGRSLARPAPGGERWPGHAPRHGTLPAVCGRTAGRPCAAGAAVEQLSADIAAQRKGAEGITPSKGTENEWKQGLTLLDDAARLPDAGRAYLALDRLAAARMLLGPFAS